MNKETILKNFQSYITEEQSTKLYQWLVDNIRTLYKEPEERVKELLGVDDVTANKLIEQFSQAITPGDGIFLL